MILPDECYFPPNLYWGGGVDRSYLCKREPTAHICVNTEELKKTHNTFIYMPSNNTNLWQQPAQILTCSLRAPIKRLCDKNAKACLSEKILPSSKGQFHTRVPSLISRLLRALPRGNKGFSPPAWQWYNQQTLQKKQARTEGAPSSPRTAILDTAMFTHAFQLLSPQRRPGRIVKGTAPAE